MDGLAAAVAGHLGGAIAAARPLRGGDLSVVRHLTLTDGRAVVAKLGPLVDREARMLEKIRATGAHAPEVLGVSGGVLLLQALDETPACPAGWRALGEGLRKLHGTTGHGYGWEEDYAFGPVAISNRQNDDWPAFWAERRLLAAQSALPADIARRLEALAARLPVLLPSTPPASLLHGDLWAGNVLFSGANAYLIDPASYYGHCEVDLAMLHLFGAPGAGFADAYGPFEPDAAERRTVYQLWPALVHLRLFGAGYRGMVEKLLARLGT
jgi:fructosamine-3-kinase